jgi:hypothetical protein
LSFTENTAAYDYPFLSHSLLDTDFLDSLWIEPEAMDYSSQYGVAICHANSTYIWLSTPDGVWRSAPSTAYSDIDLSTDVLRISETAYRYSDRAAVGLRNESLQYQNPGQGSLSPIKQNSELRLSPGYRTPQGIEVSDGPTYWLRGWEYTSAGGKATFVLHARGGWELLASWRSRCEWHFNGEKKNLNEASFTVLALLKMFVARIGLGISIISQSDTIDIYNPDFTVFANARGRNTVEKLLAMVTDVLFFTDGEGKIKNPLSSESSSYSYGGEPSSSHVLFEGRYRSFPWDIHQIQALGRDPTSGAPIEIEALGRIFEITGEETEDWREVEIESLSGVILIPTNCGQEPYDVIEITDSRAGLSSEKRRVLGLALTFYPQRARYFHRLNLGAV